MSSKAPNPDYVTAEYEAHTFELVDGRWVYKRITASDVPKLPIGRFKIDNYGSHAFVPADYERRQ